MKSTLQQMCDTLRTECRTYDCSNKEPKAYKLLSEVDARLFGLNICLQSNDHQLFGRAHKTLMAFVKLHKGVDKLCLAMFRPARASSKRLARYPSTSKELTVARRKAFQVMLYQVCALARKKDGTLSPVVADE